MKKAHILHNPTAGSQEKSKKELIALFEAKGFDWGYSSTKKSGLKKMHKKTDFLVVAGGDGTVRRTALRIFGKKLSPIRLPILLLPLGTANNIARSLGIPPNVEEIITQHENLNKKKFDAGRIKGFKKEMLFLESFGYGIFPELMNKMREIPEREGATPEENLKRALEVLHDTVMHYTARTFEIEIDGALYHDQYILVEVMNIPFLGPNLKLSPDSDPGDGEFEVIMIPESQRTELASHVSYKISGIEKPFTPMIVRGRLITISTGSGNIHTDDELIEVKKAKKVTIQPEPGMMEFFV